MPSSRPFPHSQEARRGFGDRKQSRLKNRTAAIRGSRENNVASIPKLWELREVPRGPAQGDWGMRELRQVTG